MLFRSYYDINLSVGSVLLGSLLAIVLAKVIEFFRFCVDYSRTEKVQFEDDEYYYYVKAVPKMVVPMQTRTVKRINTPRTRKAEDSDWEEPSYAAGSGRQGSRTVTTERSSSGGNSLQGSRTVTTERIVPGTSGRRGSGTVDRSAPGGARRQGGRAMAAERTASGASTARNTGRTQGRSVTIGRAADLQDDCDEAEWPYC